MIVNPGKLQAATSETGVSPRGPSAFTLLILAAVGYGGYRIYRHFKKG